ncbi:hypothetical protein ACGFIF_37230 [Kribbella sp. NPDC049174]|uniref:hypothetical protein n=1 Tax=Kribbella sp. NPDC049174 TaxID=3364112 RepID=UPI0037192718
MPSDLQRVARGLVESLDEVPQVVQHLQRTADRCRENAQVALMASHGRATVAAQQLDAAARACEAAAHYLSMAPPKARAWAERLIGDGSTTDRPSSDSADRNKATGGTGDLAERDSKGRTKRLTATFEDLDLPEDNEPPLITIARKAFEKFRKQREKDEDQRDDPEDLEVEITVTETGELLIEERDEKEDQKREDRLLQDFQIAVDLTEPVKELLAAMAESNHQAWDHAVITITPAHAEATFDYPEDNPQPIVVDIDLPDLPKPEPADIDPAIELRPLGPDFTPGVHDPERAFRPHELVIAERLAEEGWRIDARLADHSKHGQKNPDVMVRKSATSKGVVTEFKTPISSKISAVKRNMNTGSSQAGWDGEVVIDGRQIGLSESDAERAFRRACGQPGSRVASMVHVILGDGRLVSYVKES